MTQGHKERGIQYILTRLKTANQTAQKFNDNIRKVQLESNKISQLYQNMDYIVSKIGQVCTKLDLFENAVMFMNQPNRASIEPIRSQKLGIYQHSIKQQIQNQLINQDIDRRIQDQNSLLGKKMYRMNRTLDQCIDYLIEKL